MILGGCISKSKDCLQPSTLFFNSPWCERMKEKFFLQIGWKITCTLSLPHFFVSCISFFTQILFFRTYLIKMHFSLVQFFFTLVLLRRTSFWPPSMVYISINRHIYFTDYNSLLGLWGQLPCTASTPLSFDLLWALLFAVPLYSLVPCIFI